MVHEVIDSENQTRWCPPGHNTIMDARPKIGYGASIIRKLINSGELGHVRLGRRILITDEQIAEYLRKCQIPPVDKKAKATKLAQQIASRRTAPRK
ncbi:MAG TPA: helix-turn-helix domain-containing protein [Candidatus Obscuribacterales bacterium]